MSRVLDGDIVIWDMLSHSMPGRKSGPYKGGAACNREALTQCCFNVGEASVTLARHSSSMGRVCLGGRLSRGTSDRFTTRFNPLRRPSNSHYARNQRENKTTTKRQRSASTRRTTVTAGMKHDQLLRFVLTGQTSYPLLYTTANLLWMADCNGCVC